MSVLTHLLKRRNNYTSVWQPCVVGERAHFISNRRLFGLVEAKVGVLLNLSAGKYTF